MIRILTLLTSLILCALAAGPLQAATAAEELADLLGQQAALQREQEQYETSMRLLRANKANPGSIVTLEEQINAARIKILELKEKELKLRRSMADSAPGANDAGTKTTPEVLEVQRLKILLSRYYAEEERAKAQGIVDAKPERTDQTAAPRSYSADQVLLSGAESISAINDITARLESDSVTSSQRREIDVIYHIEIRSKGTLVSSKSYSLKALGRSQYVSKVSLGPGKASISVKADKWTAELTEESQGDYLVIMSTYFDQPPELHLIPVQALRDTGWKTLPPWLPYLGTAQGT